MTRLSRRTLLAGSATCLLLPQKGQAQGIPVIDISSIGRQIIAYALQAAQFARQGQQYSEQVLQYENQVFNTLSLPTQVWATVQNDIAQIHALTQIGSLLTGNAGTLIGRLQTAAAEANIAVNLPTNYQTQFAQWQNTLGTGLLSMQKQLGMQNTQQVSNAAIVRQLQASAATAQGQKQAMDAGNQLAAQNANELLQVNATLMAIEQANASQFAVANERQAVADQGFANWIKTPYVTMTGQRF